MSASKPTKVKISQSDFYEEVANNTGHSRADVATILDEAQAAIVANLKNGSSVQLGIGAFKRADRAARTGRNPHTGAALQIEAKNGASFKVGSKLRNALN